MDFSFYKTEMLDVIIEDVAFKILQINNVDELFERLIAKGAQHEDVKDERIPYWAELWPAAIGMSQYLIQKQIIQARQRVLEIGCGLGLPGIVAGKLGAIVTLTDYMDDALVFAQRNWDLNHPGQNAQFVKMDWREPDPALAADVVLASDVTYEQRFFEFLLPAFKTLCKPGGRILISDPNRGAATGFFEQMNRAGFINNQRQYAVKSIKSGALIEVSVYELTLS